MVVLRGLTPHPSGYKTPMPAAQRAWLRPENWYRRQKHQELRSPGCCHGPATVTLSPWLCHHHDPVPACLLPAAWWQLLEQREEKALGLTALGSPTERVLIQLLRDRENK